MRFGKKKPKTPAEWIQQAAAFEKIMGDCQKAAGGGGGVSSGVRRLMIQEKRIGTPTLPISQGHISGKMADTPDGGVAYDFYLRGSNVSFDANVAITELFRRVTSAVCATEAYRSMARGWQTAGGKPSPIPRLHVPKLFCCADKSMGAYFARAVKAVEAKIPNWWTQGSASKGWQSMAIVQGVRCETVSHYAEKNLPFPKTVNFRGHACALGVIHALDMILGNGDRLQRPNTGNFFIEEHGSVIAIDCDSALPPQGSGHDQLWRDVVLAGGAAVRRTHMDLWTFLIDVAEFAPYTRNAHTALVSNLDQMVSALKSFKDPTFDMYCNQMTMHKESFVKAALMTFREMKKMAPDLRNWFHEDETCSGKSLLAKINALAGL